MVCACAQPLSPTAGVVHSGKVSHAGRQCQCRIWQHTLVASGGPVLEVWRHALYSNSGKSCALWSLCEVIFVLGSHVKVVQRVVNHHELVVWANPL
jgi:hypothetical protein